MATVLEFEGLPGRTLHLWLFRQVANSSEIQTQVQSQSLEPECSFINAALVADAWLVHLAAFKALAADARGSLKTKSLHGELVHNLSGTKHIGESFRRYGVSPETQHLLVCRFDMQPGEEERIKNLIKGEQAPLSALGSLTDTKALLKFHKCTPGEQKLSDLVGSIAARIAARDC